MKLIKLVSDSDLTEAVFNNSLAYPLTIKPYSEVALKNLSLQFNNPKYEVNASNNTFSYKASAGTLPKTITLANGLYTLQELIDEVQLKMNNILNSTGIDSYLDWTVGTQESLRNLGETNLILGFSREGTELSITQAECRFNNLTFGTPKIIKTTNSSVYDGKLQCNKLLANGGFSTSITVSNQDSTPITTSDWIWGISNGATVFELSAKLEILPFMFCCISNNLDKYTYRKGGVMVDTTITITSGDKLSIQKLDGKINYIIERGGSVLATLEGDIINEVIPRLGVNPLFVNLFIGSDSGKIAFQSLTEITKPTVVVSNGSYSVLTASEIPDVYYNSNLTGTTKTKITISFPSIGIKRLLGFSADERSVENVSYKFVGDLALTTQFLNNDLEVEIIEMSINNYTHTFKQLRPLVMTIPGTDVRDSIVSYSVSFFELSWSESANFVWMDLENKQDLRLASLTVRITSNGQVLEMNGKATATLLIKESKHSE